MEQRKRTNAELHGVAVRLLLPVHILCWPVKRKGPQGPEKQALLQGNVKIIKQGEANWLSPDS